MIQRQLYVKWVKFDYFHVVTYSNMEEDAIVVPAAVDHLPTIS